MQSIQVFDTKSASLLAIGVGALYVLTTVVGKPSAWKYLADFETFRYIVSFTEGSSWLCLIAGIISAILATGSWSDRADKDVVGGDITIPQRVLKIAPSPEEIAKYQKDHPEDAKKLDEFGLPIGIRQAVFTARIEKCEKEELAKQLGALVYSRCQIRSYKYGYSWWAILFLILGIGLLAFRILFNISCPCFDQPPLVTEKQNAESLATKTPKDQATSISGTNLVDEKLPESLPVLSDKK